MHRKPRRILAGILIAVGGLMLWLAPEASTLGIVLLILAALIEIVGIYLEHKDAD
jgi:drug/metabolite transporter (DMT)-like permease